MQQFQFANNWTWTKGRHTIKFGPDIRRLQNLRVPSDIHRSGDVYFSNAFTEGPNGPGLGTASFLLGDASNMGRYVSTSTDAGERQWRTFFYGEDIWKATSKLTSNLWSSLGNLLPADRHRKRPRGLDRPEHRRGVGRRRKWRRAQRKRTKHL